MKRENIAKVYRERSVDAEVRRRNMSCKYMTRILQQECQSILEFCSTLFSRKEWKDERRILYGKPENSYEKLPEGALLVLFSGEETIKTNDEYYPFFADRSFVYLTGLSCKQAVLMAAKDGAGQVKETLYILPPDAFARALDRRACQTGRGTGDFRGTGDQIHRPV